MSDSNPQPSAKKDRAKPKKKLSKYFWVEGSAFVAVAVLWIVLDPSTEGSGRGMGWIVAPTGFAAAALVSPRAWRFFQIYWPKLSPGNKVLWVLWGLFSFLFLFALSWRAIDEGSGDPIPSSETVPSSDTAPSSNSPSPSN
ncbi:MAG: hypothetical protein AAF517_12065 [Planctomycetota bacterium]